MLRCDDGSVYVGHTDQLEKRIAEHHLGIASTYTARRRPLVLIWTDLFNERSNIAERRIKKWSRAKKLALAVGDYDLLSVLGKKKTWKKHREGRV